MEPMRLPNMTRWRRKEMSKIAKIAAAAVVVAAVGAFVGVRF